MVRDLTTVATISWVAMQNIVNWVDRPAAEYLTSLQCECPIDSEGFIAAICLYGVKVPAAQVMSRIDALTRAGACSRVTEFAAQRTDLSDDDLNVLRRWPELSRIEVANTSVTGHGFRLLAEEQALRKLEALGPGVVKHADLASQAISQLPRLRSVALLYSDLTDDGVEALSASTSLEHLDITGTVTTGKGIATLAKVQTLRELLVGETCIDDAAVEALSILPCLESISMYRSNVTDRGAARLSTFPALRRIMLDGTRVTDEGLGYLARLKHLESLTVQNTGITQSAVDIFGQMKQLMFLMVDFHRLGSNGIQRLRQKLSSCMIVDPSEEVSSE
jgi:internalin A